MFGYVKVGDRVRVENGDLVLEFRVMGVERTSSYVGSGMVLKYNGGAVVLNGHETVTVLHELPKKRYALIRSNKTKAVFVRGYEGDGRRWQDIRSGTWYTEEEIQAGLRVRGDFEILFEGVEE